MTPIEKVAAALQKAWNEDGVEPNWLPPIEFTDNELRHLARAAIEALREPSQAMIDAPSIGSPGDRHAIWQDMLGAALNEGGGR